MDEIDEHYPSSQYEFFFGRVVSLERAVEIVAIGGLLIETVWVIYWPISNPFGWSEGGSPVLACLCVLLLVALNKQNPRLFIPYLIANAISIAFSAIYCIVLAALMLFSSQFWDGVTQLHPSISVGLIKVWIFMHLVGSIAKVGVNTWFWQIIHRAYTYMRTQNLENQPLLA